MRDQNLLFIYELKRKQMVCESNRTFSFILLSAMRTMLMIYDLSGRATRGKREKFDEKVLNVSFLVNSRLCTVPLYFIIT